MFAGFIHGRKFKRKSSGFLFKCFKARLIPYNTRLHVCATHLFTSFTATHIVYSHSHTHTHKLILLSTPSYDTLEPCAGSMFYNHVNHALKWLRCFFCRLCACVRAPGGGNAHSAPWHLRYRASLSAGKLYGFNPSSWNSVAGRKHWCQALPDCVALSIEENVKSVRSVCVCKQCLDISKYSGLGGTPVYVGDLWSWQIL